MDDKTPKAHPPANRLAAIDAIDAYVGALYAAPEMETDTETAIVDLITDLLYLADLYRTEEYGIVTDTTEQILERVAAFREQGI